MTPQQATGFRDAYDAQVRRLSPMSKRALAAIERTEMRRLGITRIAGGPVTKDEFITSILTLHGYTVERLNQAGHTLHHETPWPDCRYCAGVVTGVAS